MWFLIAGEQITQAKNHLNQSMTMEQLLEAEQRGAEWIRKMRKIPPSSIENPPNASTAWFGKGSNPVNFLEAVNMRPLFERCEWAM
jgi:hypothetical protein